MSFGAINNPPVPFTLPLSHGLHDGFLVVISGAVTHSGDRFNINFQCGHSSNDDIAFHFNPRFIDGGIVVCNTKERQSWGKEENKREMPFHRHQPFEIRILVTNHSYNVSVNRNHYLEYHHRIPIQRVNTMTIGGCVALTCVNAQGPQHPGYAPQPFPPGGAFNPQFPAAPHQQQSYAMPYQTNIYGGLFPSKTIVIRGTVTANPKRFHINLKFHGGTALHFNPRFDERTIVRNSHLNGSWGNEERNLPRGMCFAPGQSFVIEIRCEQHAFKVNVNGAQICEFHHRVHQFQQIDTLQIDGDVVLQHVQV
ncbi:lectin, galactoside-binding, soluble, 9C L homeolog [Xenopus laevis]|uniref:Galectin n=1 Tax=Xenopus laevis TaxID=8355 RepID=Q7ZTB8_XENLA|nr:lectin, galactoside-binding, soluble, 9C L homeolog [Xenopus laevis]BAC55883.1 galectin family xgalectin-IIIb [Xenopus laevis]